MTALGIVSLLHGIREAFGIAIFIRITKNGFDIRERSPINGELRTIKTCYTLDAVKQYLADLMICEEVFSNEV